MLYFSNKYARGEITALLHLYICEKPSYKIEANNLERIYFKLCAVDLPTSSRLKKVMEGNFNIPFSEVFWYRSSESKHVLQYKAVGCNPVQQLSSSWCWQGVVE